MRTNRPAPKTGAQDRRTSLRAQSGNSNRCTARNPQPSDIAAVVGPGELKPRGGAGDDTALRLIARSASPISSGRRRPRPISTNMPTRLRTIWWVKALAVISNCTVSPTRRHCARSMVRTKVSLTFDLFFFENDEVVLAKNLIGRQLHGPDLGGSRTCQTRSRTSRVGPDRVQDAIAVAASHARDPGIEVRGRQSDITHRDLRGEHPIERSCQGDSVEVIGVGVERHDLTTSVHTPIGAPRTRHRDRRSQDLRQRLVEIVLHLRTSGLVANPWNGAPS